MGGFRIGFFGTEAAGLQLRSSTVRLCLLYSLLLVFSFCGAMLIAFAALMCHADSVPSEVQLRIRVWLNDTCSAALPMARYFPSLLTKDRTTPFSLNAMQHRSFKKNYQSLWPHAFICTATSVYRSADS